MKFIAYLFFGLLISQTLFSQKQIKMVLIEGGTFEMGSDTENFPDESPVHTVKLNDFYISQYEVLYDDYLAFCKVAGYSPPEGEMGYPAVNISWERAVMLCNWLSGRDGYEHAYKIRRDDSKGVFEVSCDFEKNGYRLPTEAEWEYAARGGHRGKRSIFSGSNSPYNVAWFSENHKNKKHKPGELYPNEIGIYDMSGNVEEWCWDFYQRDYYKHSPEVNPKGPVAGIGRVIRGGSMRSRMDYIIITRRQFKDENHRDMYLGLRLVRTKTD